MNDISPATPPPDQAPPSSPGLGTTGAGSVGGSPTVTPPAAADELKNQAAKLGDEVAQLEKEKPQAEAPLIAPQDHTDPNPIFPGSVVPAESTAPKVGIAHTPSSEKKTWKLFSLGFVLGAVIFGGLTGFLLNSYYNTQKSQLELKATQQLQQLKDQSTPASGSSSATTPSTTTPTTGY